jgi:hypothetical protein
VRRAVVAVAAAAAIAFVPAAGGAYGRAERAGTITAEALPEISGLAAATVVPGGWWAVNDSGHTAELHLVSGKGALLASVRVRGASNVDWEDLAAGPGAGGRRTLYVADIGDNGKERDDLVVYRVSEPRLGDRSAAAEQLRFRYPDGSHDAEALFVDPASGRIYVLTKTRASAEPCRLYRFPLPLRPGSIVTLARVGGPFAKLVAPLRLVTGAASSPDGTRLAIRTYLQAWEWRRSPSSAFESILGGAFQQVRLPLERQGESIAYTSDGTALATTSEGLPAPIWRLPGRG